MIKCFGKYFMQLALLTYDGSGAPVAWLKPPTIAEAPWLMPGGSLTSIGMRFASSAAARNQAASGRLLLLGYTSPVQFEKQARSLLSPTGLKKRPR